ncbi:MAG: hypothetical protein AB8G11_14990 [Saprospiraceae bacterium]
MKRIILTVFLCIAFFYTQAQNFGGHPADVKWKHIDTENVKVIFPEGMELQAFRIANMTDHIRENNTASVGDKSKKLNIVLHNNQVISNGFVALSPFRSEFFATAPQDFNFLGSMEWLDALTIHEYRHALQFRNGRKGLTALGYILQGEGAWNLLLGLNLPNWYFEGDAVVSETLLSEAGRGRTPAFFATQRANLLNDMDYTYMKSRNGSFKDIVPDQYSLGFTMCNYTRNQFGTEIWSEILKDAGAYRYPWLYPFSFSLKRNAGFHVHKIYQQSYDSLQTQWQEELKTLALTPTKPVTEKDKKTVTNYRYSQVLDDGSLIVLKSSYKETPAIYKITNNEERKITDVGFATESFLSENNNQLAWTEYSVDTRRANVNYSDVVTYDLSTGEKKYLTTESKYFSPHFNSKGTEIAVVEANEKFENSIIILDKNGQAIQQLDNPDNWFLAYPKWTNDDNAIVYVAKNNNQVALFKFNIWESTNIQLTDWTHHTITVPMLDDEYAYFSASYSGIDNIYAVNLNGDKIIKQLTSVKIGAYQPAIIDETLYISEQTERGLMLSQITVKPNNQEQYKYVEPAQMQRYNIKTTTAESNILDNNFDKTHEVENYNTLLKGLRLHGWSLSALSQSEVSANLQFGNVIDDLRANLILSYNNNEATTSINGEVTIGKWLPELTLKGSNAKRVAYYNPDNIVDSFNLFAFDDRSFGIAASIPFSWVKGNYTTDARFTSNVLMHKTSNYSRNDAPMITEVFPTWENNITFSRLHRKAVQHILPRYGQEVNLTYNVGLIDRNINSISLTGTAYFPGLSPNHGIEVNAGFKHELLLNPYQFSDVFEYSRGYLFPTNDNVLKASVNYNFPIAYPDWGFFNFAYFKRIRGNIFADFSTLALNDERFNQNAVGAELIFDNIFLNVAPISFGVRSSYLLNTDLNNPTQRINIETFTAMEF